MRIPDQLLDQVPETTLEIMLYWARQGWAVIPLAPRGKEPITSHGIKDATTDEDTIRRWADQWPDANVGGSTAGKLVLDIDPRSGGRLPSDLPSTRFHRSGRGDGGGHLIFALTPMQQGSGVRSGASKLGDGVDVKTGANSYVVLPGSTHPEGGRYESDLAPILTAPDELVRKLAKATNSAGGGGGVRSLLSSLLAKPDNNGRNDWLTAISGHYAKTYRKSPDIYRQLVSDANDKLQPPLDRAEMDKIATSIWNKETQGHPERDLEEAMLEESGFLLSGDYTIICAALEGPKEATQVVPANWADFDMKLQGKIIDTATETIVYDIRLQRRQNRSEIVIGLSASDFGDARKLQSTLASYGVSVAGAERMVHRNPAWNIRLLRYVQAQTAPEMEMAPALGYDPKEHGYVTIDGVISADGPRGHVKVRPDPKLRNSGVMPYEYGFAKTADYATGILSRVLEFHEETTAAAFGSWWAANWAKHHVLRHISFFPVMAIESASGSGKTNGLFALLFRLSGNTGSPGLYTQAALRNSLSVNSMGITWVDDLDDPIRVHEIIRSLTSASALSKMNEDNSGVSGFGLVGSLLFSGEALGLSGQKALLERCVALSPEVPIDRVSKRPETAGRVQWLDVLELRNEIREVGGEAALAGHFATMVLRMEHEIEATITQLVAESGKGRSGERDVSMRLGARILDAMLSVDEGEYRKAWDGAGRWAGELERYFHPDVDPDEMAVPTLQNESKLTIELIPWALSSKSHPTDAFAPGGGVAAFVEEGVIWFSPKRLAQTWEEHQHGRVDIRTESADSLVKQAKQLGLGGKIGGATSMRRQCRTSQRSAEARQTYWAIRGELAEAVLARSYGH